MHVSSHVWQQRPGGLARASVLCLAAGLRELVHFAPTVAVVATTGLVAYLIARGIQLKALVLWPDSFGFLKPAVSALSGGPFIRYGREFLYPAFIYAMTALQGDLLGVVYGQLILYTLTLAGPALARRVHEGRGFALLVDRCRNFPSRFLAIRPRRTYTARCAYSIRCAKA
jgi:hypothetical protein